MRGQRQYIVAVFAQGRQFNREDAEAVVKVLAELTRIDRLLQVAVGRGDDANVDLSAASVADPLNATGTDVAATTGTAPN
jgi:hypothetical protein